MTADPAIQPQRPSPRPGRGGRRRLPETLGQRLARSRFIHRASAAMVRVFMKAARWLGAKRSERFAVAFFRVVGPLIKENRTAAANIAAALPEKSAAERQAIIRGCWENFAKVVVEFVFLDELVAEFNPDRPNQGRITVAGVEHFLALRDDGKPGVIFAAHLANWEMLGAVAAKFGLKTVLPFRAPANVHFADDVLRQREAMMGHLVANIRGASFEIAAELEKGAHLGMLIDQRRRRGLALPFFGRPAWTNPLAARIARQFDCPVHGARAIRLPGGRLHLELTPPIELPRDDEGLIDVTAASTRFNEIVEGWVREHPDQYFWLHDRWKP